MFLWPGCPGRRKLDLGSPISFNIGLNSNIFMTPWISWLAFMICTFHLRSMLSVTTGIAMFFGLATNENYWLATATIGCLGCWCLIAISLAWFGRHAWRVSRIAWAESKLGNLTQLFRSVPLVVIAATLFVIVMALTNAVRQESLGISATVVTWAALAVPLCWGMMLLRTQQSCEPAAASRWFPYRL